MTGKKTSRLGALKDTTGGNRRDDRQVIGKTTFEPISIDAKNALTVVYMLRSPEDNVVLRAVASLEGFARKAPENLKLLSSLGIFEYLFPLVRHKDNIIKRFSQKLIGMLCSLEEFREQLLREDNILNTFVDVLEKEMDVVMHEFAALTLAELSREYRATSELLKVENCIETLFLRITSVDPDVKKNCLDVMNHLLNYISGVEAFLESPSFEIRLLLELLPSSYPVIQTLAIEVLTQLTSWSRDTRVLFAFRDATGIEMVLDILENAEWRDLHMGALDLLLNVVDCPDLCDYLLQSGCLRKLINLLDLTDDRSSIEKILGVLARISQTHRGRLALLTVDMGKRFSEYLKERIESIQEAAALGIANLGQYPPCLDSIMANNPVPILLEIIISTDNNLNLRTLAAYALNILCNEDVRASEALVDDYNLENLFNLLILDLEDLSVELCKNLIQVFIGVSLNDDHKAKIIRNTLISALLSCLGANDASRVKDPSLEVDALECLSVYLTEWVARAIFDSLNGTKWLLQSLRSKFASVRERAGHLVVVASQSKYFVKNFIRNGGLEWMLHEKNTMYSMPSWQSAIEAIFTSYLPAKFAYTGRLDFGDITQDGFYLWSNPRIKFCLLDDFLEAQVCPISPVYYAIFQMSANPSTGDSETFSNNSTPKDEKSQSQTERPPTPQNLQKFMRGADRNSLEEYKWSGSINTYSSKGDTLGFGLSKTDYADSYTGFTPDPYLNDYLENLKQKLAKEEPNIGDTNWFCIHPKLVRERARIIAEFVVGEMSGPEPSPICCTHYKEMHINEMKVHLGTNIIPLGYIRMGDYLERAMLFKVLSDRIGFPCSLVRGKKGRAWIEIAVPVINIEDLGDQNLKKGNQTTKTKKPPNSKETLQTSQTSITTINCGESILPEKDYWFPKLRIEHFKAFPSFLLKPNAIVDLIETPGRLFNINSSEAEEYCGTFLFSKSK